MKTITRSEFKAMGKEWTALDAEYDAEFQTFFDNPKSTTFAKFKDMQGRIYPLEDEIYKVAERFFSAQEIQEMKAKQKRLSDIEIELYQVAEGKMIIQD